MAGVVPRRAYAAPTARVPLISPPHLPGRRAAAAANGGAATEEREKGIVLGATQGEVHESVQEYYGQVTLAWIVFWPAPLFS